MLELKQVWSHPLRALNASFNAGLHVVLGRPEDGIEQLAELCAGFRSVPRGSVRVYLRDPYRTAQIREQIGAVLPEEPRLPAQRLPALIAQRMPRAAAGSASELLSTCGLLDRSTASLSADELRSVAFLVATSVQRKLLVMYEPFMRLPGIHSHAIAARLRAQVAGGAITLAFTANPAHAKELGGTAWLLDRGQLSETNISTRQYTEHPIELVIGCSAARELASAMLEESGVGVNFDPERPEQLVVTTAQPDLASLRLMQHASQRGIAVHGLTRREQTVDQLRAAAAGRAHAAFQRAAQAPAPNAAVPDARGVGAATDAPPLPGPSFMATEGSAE